MTKRYARLTTGGVVEYLRRVPHVVNASEADFEAYAADHGYKEFVGAGERPGRFYELEYVETADELRAVWAPWELDRARTAALDEVQQLRDMRMHGAAGVTIECEKLPNGIKFDTEAMSYATGLVVLTAKGGGIPEGTTWTDAADETHELTAELLEGIVSAMQGHVKAVQEYFTPYRDAIRAAETVDEVEAALPQPNAFLNQ